MLGKLVCCYGNGCDATSSAFVLHCQIQCKEINEGEVSRLLYKQKTKNTPNHYINDELIEMFLIPQDIQIFTFFFYR